MKLRKLYQCDGGPPVQPTDVTTPMTLVSTELPGKCEDSHQYCGIWSQMGECDKNSAWMAVSCRKSCNQCKVDCADFNAHCAKWAKAAECSNNRDYMQLYCAKSCAVCGTGQLLFYSLILLIIIRSMRCS